MTNNILNKIKALVESVKETNPSPARCTLRTEQIYVTGGDYNEVLERLIDALKVNTFTYRGLANNKIMITKFTVITEDPIDSFKITLWGNHQLQGSDIREDSFKGTLEGPGHVMRIGKRKYMFDSCEALYEDLTSNYGITFTVHTKIDATLVIEFEYMPVN